MIDKNIIKSTMNDRLKEIDEFVDTIIPNDAINKLIKKYDEVLDGFQYIDLVGLFSVLKLRGQIRYIGRYDKQLRYGGLLIKIYQKNDDWYAILKQTNGKKYHVSFNNNYIFYKETKHKTKDDLIREWSECFIADCKRGEYEII